LKEDYVISKVNDPRILPIVTQTLKEVIGNHALKDGTETRQLYYMSKRLERRVEYVQVSL
jgi:hypothetical protein